MAVSVCLLANPPIWFRLKLLINWMNCHEIVCRRSWCPEGDFSDPMTFPLAS